MQQQRRRNSRSRSSPAPAGRSGSWGCSTSRRVSKRSRCSVSVIRSPVTRLRMPPAQRCRRLSVPQRRLNPPQGQSRFCLCRRRLSLGLMRPTPIRNGEQFRATELVPCPTLRLLPGREGTRWDRAPTRLVCLMRRLGPPQPPPGIALWSRLNGRWPKWKLVQILLSTRLSGLGVSLLRWRGSRRSRPLDESNQATARLRRAVREGRR